MTKPQPVAKPQLVAKQGANVLPMVRQQRLARRDATLPTILEFQWPSTAIVNAPIPRSARGIAWIISSMVFVMIAGAGLIPVDEVVTTKGIVVSQSPTILVQPLETAIVRSIDVREGETVKAGQVLAQLDPTFATADAGALTAQVAEHPGRGDAPSGRGGRQAPQLHRQRSGAEAAILDL